MPASAPISTLPPEESRLPSQHGNPIPIFVPISSDQSSPIESPPEKTATANHRPADSDSDSPIILPKVSYILDTLFRLVGLVAAFVFGAWAIRAYHAAQLSNSLAQQSISLANQALEVAQQANNFALISNQLAFYASCLQGFPNKPVSNTGSAVSESALVCEGIQEDFPLRTSLWRLLHRC